MGQGRSVAGIKRRRMKKKLFVDGHRIYRLKRWVSDFFYALDKYLAYAD